MVGGIDAGHLIVVISRVRLSVDHHPEKNKRSEIRAELCIVQPELLPYRELVFLFAKNVTFFRVTLLELKDLEKMCLDPLSNLAAHVSETPTFLRA